MRIFILFQKVCRGLKLSPIIDKLGVGDGMGSGVGGWNKNDLVRKKSEN